MFKVSLSFVLEDIFLVRINEPNLSSSTTRLKKITHPPSERHIVSLIVVGAQLKTAQCGSAMMARGFQEGPHFGLHAPERRQSLEQLHV